MSWGLGRLFRLRVEGCFRDVSLTAPICQGDRRSNFLIATKL